MSDAQDEQDYTADIRKVRKRRWLPLKLFCLGVALIVLGFVVIATVTANETGSGEEAALTIFSLALGPGIVLSTVSFIIRVVGYRCPRCRTFLGHGWPFPNFCPGCALDLREKESWTDRTSS